MRRIFVHSISDITIITGEEHKHLSIVLRAKKGDEVILCDRSGFDFFGTIIDINKNETKVRIYDKKQNECEPSCRVSLFFGSLKGDKNELVVQKCTELGVGDFYPLISKYTQKNAENIKGERLQKIALEAAKQCGRGKCPVVYPPVEFINLPKMLKEYTEVLFLYEEERNSSLTSFLARQKVYDKTAIIIGSEGGFCKEEAALLAECGVKPLHMGKRILRAETAAIAVLSLLMNAAGELE